MRNALAADLQRLDKIAVTCVASPAAPLPTALARVRPLRPAAPALEFLAAEARRHDRVWVIAPESDDMLASLAAAVGRERWVGCSLPAIRLAASKSATRRRLAEHAIAVPAAWQPGDPEPDGDGPWVVKPDDGAGSVDTHLYTDFAEARNDLLRRLAEGRASTLEAWVTGVPLSLSLLCADGHAEVLSINQQRIVARPDAPVAYAGVDIQAVPVDSPNARRLGDLAQRVVAAVPGLAGYVGIDLVWQPTSHEDWRRHPPEPVVIEINPRLTCAYVGLSAALGRNLAGEILVAQAIAPVPHVLH
jgi:tyramine---L-glutamate ligase